MKFLGLSNKSTIQKIEQMQTLLAEVEEESTKAKAQEEILLGQLNEIFECDSLEEAKELLEEAINEKEKLDEQLNNETNTLYEKMKADGLIR
jgi:transcriptional regulator with PAS, ATPase and Fis domain